jgi:flagellum-specific peptidoglycan hydrolase FlgJ
MKQLKKQISEKEETTSTPRTNLLNFKPRSLIKFLKWSLILALFGIVILLISTSLEAPTKAMEVSKNYSSIENSLYIYNVRNYSEEKLITEVDLYMKSVAPTEKLDARLLVQLCSQYEMDLSFVIAQAILESHIGTKGRAIRTNSVWNVGTYDSGITHYTYHSPNESIEPYLKLLKNRYMVKINARGDTLQRGIKNLIADNGFVNSEGKRFATSLTYESFLRYWLLQVQMNSKIKLYQDIKSMPDEDILGFFVSRKEPIDSILMAKL